MKKDTKNDFQELEKVFEFIGISNMIPKEIIEDIESEITSNSEEKISEIADFVENRKEWQSHEDINQPSRIQTELTPIGLIHSPLKDDETSPFQANKSEVTAEVEVFKKYGEALEDLEGYSHIILIFEFNRSIKHSQKENLSLESHGLKVKPYLDDKLHGIFSTRSPNRPNPIGLSTVELLEREKNMLKVKGVDMFDETPLLDIKPYVPEFDVKKKPDIGWLENRL